MQNPTGDGADAGATTSRPETYATKASSWSTSSRFTRRTAARGAGPRGTRWLGRLQVTQIGSSEPSAISIGVGLLFLSDELVLPTPSGPALQRDHGGGALRWPTRPRWTPTALSPAASARTSSAPASAAGISQEDARLRAGAPPDRGRDAGARHPHPPIDTALKLARALGVSVDDLVEGIEWSAGARNGRALPREAPRRPSRQMRPIPPTAPLRPRSAIRPRSRVSPFRARHSPTQSIPETHSRTPHAVSPGASSSTDLRHPDTLRTLRCRAWAAPC